LVDDQGHNVNNWFPDINFFLTSSVHQTWSCDCPVGKEDPYCNFERGNPYWFFGPRSPKPVS